MKILIPIIGFGSAGGYRVLSELANRWIRLGFVVDFLVERGTQQPYFPTSATIIFFDIKGNLYFDKEQGNSHQNRRALDIYVGMFRALVKLKNKYDLILANHSLTTYPVFLSGKSKSIKVYYIQAYEPEYYSLNKGIKNKILQLLSKLSYKLPLKQIVNAEVYLKYKEINAIDWVPPGVDEEIFYKRSSLPNSSPNLTIGIIGRIEKSKGTIYAIEAFEKLAIQHPNIRLNIAYGNLSDKWSHERASIVIPKNDSELADFYRHIDILIAPGIVQLGACHYPVIESMFCGTPVITTGYYPANESNSWIVPIKNSGAIVEAVNAIINSDRQDIEKRLDQALLDVSVFCWHDVSSKFAEKMHSFINTNNN